MKEGGESHVNMAGGRNVRGRGNSKHESPEVGTGPLCSGNSEACAAQVSQGGGQ